MRIRAAALFVLVFSLLLVMFWPRLDRVFRRELRNDIKVKNHSDFRILRIEVVTNKGKAELRDIDSHEEAVVPVPPGTRDEFDIIAVLANGKQLFARHGTVSERMFGTRWEFTVTNFSIGAATGHKLGRPGDP